MEIKDLKKKINRGFTLVELLIVIALIGILATALVATLNPIEQINKARDTRYKNDAAELLAALERYYASTQVYPWVSASITIEDEYGGMGADTSVGVCSATCATDGVLISSGELKTAFKSKEQFKATTAADKFFIRKTKGSGGSVYVCFIPKAGTNRSIEKNPSLVLVDICTAGDTSGCSTFEDPAACPVDANTDWTNASSACFVCVPE